MMTETSKVMPGEAAAAAAASMENSNAEELSGGGGDNMAQSIQTAQAVSPQSDTESHTSESSRVPPQDGQARAGFSGDDFRPAALQRTGSTSSSAAASVAGEWRPTPEWVQSWKQKLPLQTIMRLLQVLVPQVEKICIDKGLTDESEILKFLQHGTLVGLLPVPHPILIRKYQANSGTTLWFRTYMWGVIYLR
eukprot:XP_003730076.1 PREDICTED: protein HID1 [Strongylocentrotus purpuratus]